MATKGRKRLGNLSAGSDVVNLKLLQKTTVDLGLAKHTQDKIGSLEQWVFAYQHNVSDADNFDKVDGHKHYSMVVDNHFENVVFHYLQSLVARVLGRFARIAVVGIVPAMVVGPFAVA